MGNHIGHSSASIRKVYHPENTAGIRFEFCRASLIAFSFVGQKWLTKLRNIVLRVCVRWSMSKRVLCIWLGGRRLHWVVSCWKDWKAAPRSQHSTQWRRRTHRRGRFERRYTMRTMKFPMWSPSRLRLNVLNESHLSTGMKGFMLCSLCCPDFRVWVRTKLHDVFYYY